MVSRDSSNFIWQLALILIGTIIVLLIINGIDATLSYNNGSCKNCGGHYVFQTAVGHQYSTSYIYKCDKCGDLIEVTEYYGE